MFEYILAPNPIHRVSLVHMWNHHWRLHIGLNLGTWGKCNHMTSGACCYVTTMLTARWRGVFIIIVRSWQQQ